MLGFSRKKAPATENPSSPKENENKKPVEKKPLSSRQIKKAKRETARQQDKKLRLLKKNTEQQNNDTKRRAKSEAAPKNAVDYIGYKRLFDDGICEVETGLYSITLKISDINYQTARRDEQVDIFSRYCELLNTLEPPLHYQISIVDRSINKDEFRANMFMPMANDKDDKYRKIMNKMLSDKALEGQNSIIREKYVTISTTAKNYETAKTALSRVEADYGSHFKSLGCDVSMLSGAQRLELIQSLTRPYEPFLFDYETLIYSGLTTKHAIAPTSFDFTAKHTFEIGDYYGEVLYLRDLPASISDQLLTLITDLPIDLCVSLHFDKVEQGQALERVRRQLAFMEMEQAGQQEKAAEKGRSAYLSTPQEVRRQYAGAEKLLDDLENKNQRMFKGTILIYTYADTMEKLNDNVVQICSVCAQKSCTAAPLDFRQREGFNSSLPLGKNHIDMKRTLTTGSAAVFIPFTTQELYQAGGMYYGLNALSHNMVMFNRYSLKAPSGVILGTPGSGKSFAAKREMINVLLNDPNAEVLIIDPEREYYPIAAGFGGENIHISAGSKNFINPMDITDNYADDDDPLMLKSEFVLTLCELLVGGRQGLTAGQRSIVSRACTLCYQPHFANPAKNPVPTLKDFYEVLKQQPEPEARSLALSMELYIEGSLSVFAHSTNVDTKKRLVVYDIRDLGKQLRTLGMLIVLDQIWNRITQNRAIGKRTWIYIDEIQLLFSNEFSAQYFFELWSRSRKWGAIPTGITQNVETLLLSDLARRMLSNSDFIMMLNQAQPDRVELAGLLNMSSKQLSYVTNTDAGKGLLFAGKSIVPFVDNFPKDNELYQMMTTKIEEVADINRNPATSQSNEE